MLTCFHKLYVPSLWSCPVCSPCGGWNSALTWPSRRWLSAPHQLSTRCQLERLPAPSSAPSPLPSSYWERERERVCHPVDSAAPQHSHFSSDHSVETSEIFLWMTQVISDPIYVYYHHTIFFFFNSIIVVILVLLILH